MTNASNDNFPTFITFCPVYKCIIFVPILGIYLTCTMAITTLSMVLTVMVLNLHSVSERPVPRWVKILVLKHLARLFCLSPMTDEDIDGPKQERIPNHTHQHLSVGRKIRKTVSMGSALDDDTEEHLPIIAINGSVNAGQETSFVHIRTGTPYAPRNNNASKGYSEGENQEEDPPDYSKDWHKLAEVVDRLFFWTFLIAILAISILLFHPLTKEILIREKKSS